MECNLMGVEAQYTESDWSKVNIILRNAQGSINTILVLYCIFNVMLCTLCMPVDPYIKTIPQSTYSYMYGVIKCNMEYHSLSATIFLHATSLLHSIGNHHYSRHVRVCELRDSFNIRVYMRHNLSKLTLNIEYEYCIVC